MVHLLHLLLQGRHILVGHILKDQEREGTLIEVLQQFILTDDRVHVLRQIGQHVVVDTGGRHTEDRWHQQGHSQNQDQYAVFDHRFRKTHLRFLPFFIVIRNDHIRLLVVHDLHHADGNAQAQKPFGHERDTQQDRNDPGGRHGA